MDNLDVPRAITLAAKTFLHQQKLRNPTLSDTVLHASQLTSYTLLHAESVINNM